MLRLIAATSLILLAACGGEAPVIVEPMEGLFPVAVGHRWTYRVTQADGRITAKVQTVTGTVSIDGALAHRFETVRGDKGTRSIQMLRDGQLLRVSEEALDEGVIEERFRYEPFGLRVDSVRLTLGQTYEDLHEKVLVDERGATISVVMKDHLFTVEAVDESVTVPAGTFECVRLKRERGGEVTKTFWYAEGVGKVKEVGGQTEELTRAEL